MPALGLAVPMLLVAALPAAEPPAWTFAALADLAERAERHDSGLELAPSAAEFESHFRQRVARHNVVLLALDGEPSAGTELGLPRVPPEPVPVLGYASTMLGTRDNLHLADDTTLQVDPDHRGRGIGTALWRALEDIVRADGRTEVIAYSDHPLAPVEDALVPATGHGHLPRDRNALFVLRHGFVLEQVERMSRLMLPVADDVLEALLDPSASAGYRTRTWRGATPPDMVDAIARLQGRMSTDPPLGELAYQPKSWDAERVASMDADRDATGPSWTTVAIHDATGEAVGFTDLVQVRERPHVAIQWNTVVEEAHRGHRLGALIKVVNLRALQHDAPDARHVSTWNASENGHMLAINTRLGFRLSRVEGTWQRSLD